MPLHHLSRTIHPRFIPLRSNPFYESLGDLRVHPDVLLLLQSMRPPLPPTARVWCPSGQAQWLACVPKEVEVLLGLEVVKKSGVRSKRGTQDKRGKRNRPTRNPRSRHQVATTVLTISIRLSPNRDTHPTLIQSLRNTLRRLGVPYNRQRTSQYTTNSNQNTSNTSNVVTIPISTPTLTTASPTTIWSPLAITRMTHACKVTTDTLNALYTKIRQTPFPHPAFPNTLAMRAFLVNDIRTRLGLLPSTPEEDFLAYSPILMVDGGGDALIRKTGIARVHPEGVEDVVFRQLTNAPAQMVLLDIGARYGGYCADITRTFVMHPGLDDHTDDSPSSTEQRTIYNAVKAVHDFAVGEMRPGVSYEEVERQVQEMLDGYLGDVVRPSSPRWSPLRITKMPHHLGHTVGTQVHAHPPIDVLQQRYGGVLEAGMVLTVEPGVYTDRCCVRIENVVVVGEGEGRVLSGGCGW